jgi:hypothetical protein
MRGKPIPSDLYWKLRAIQAETGLLQEKLAGFSTARVAIGMVGRFAIQMEAMVGGMIQVVEGLAKAGGQEAAKVVQEIGLQIGLEGDPTEWIVDLGTGPESARISFADHQEQELEPFRHLDE